MERPGVTNINDLSDMGTLVAIEQCRRGTDPLGAFRFGMYIDRSVAAHFGVDQITDIVPGQLEQARRLYELADAFFSVSDYDPERFAGYLEFLPEEGIVRHPAVGAVRIAS